MAESIQTYKNHSRVLPPFHYFVLPVLLLNFLNSIRHVWQAPSRSTGFAVVVAAALLTLALLSRVQALSAQDRIIRLEMRLRLERLLPPELRGRIYELTPKQLIAMRFASDAELPDLTREVLDGKLPTQKAIKLRVKNWEPDWLRV